eukprot:720407_1
MIVNKCIQFVRKSKKRSHSFLGVLSILLGCNVLIRDGSVWLFVTTTTLLSMSAVPLLELVPRNKSIRVPYFGSVIHMMHKRAFTGMIWMISYLNLRLIFKIFEEQLNGRLSSVLQSIMIGVRVLFITGSISIVEFVDCVLLIDSFISITGLRSESYRAIVTDKFIIFVHILSIFITFCFTLAFRNIVSLDFAYWTSVFVSSFVLGWILLSL